MSQQTPQAPQPPQWDGDEKGRDEKGRDREWNRGRDEKRDEKGRDEKGRNDPLSSLVWAVLFVWAGLVLLADNFGYLPSIVLNEQRLEPWSLIFAGAGIIVLVEVCIRLIVPAYRRGVGGSLVGAVVLLAIGLGGWVGWNVVWPIILIAIGISILIGNLTRQ